MINPHCRIKSVRYKNGGHIIILPESTRNYRTVDLGWAEVTFRAYNNELLLNRDITYMCDVVKSVVIG
jgi:hypothetical protein